MPRVDSRHCSLCSCSAPFRASLTPKHGEDRESMEVWTIPLHSTAFYWIICGEWEWWWTDLMRWDIGSVFFCIQQSSKPCFTCFELILFISTAAAPNQKQAKAKENSPKSHISLVTSTLLLHQFPNSELQFVQNTRLSGTKTRRTTGQEGKGKSSSSNHFYSSL